MKKCINCGFELDDKDLFCAECGTKQPEQKKLCPTCGTKLNQTEKFCAECGTPIDNSNHPESNISNQKENADENMGDFKVDSPTDNDVNIIIKGVPLNLKLVKGNNYGTQNEILDYLIGETPVTQALWYIIMGDNPSAEISDLNFPVTNITPSLATSFLVKLNKMTGVKFDLPTKEQWDFAYKGGIKTKGYKYSGSNEVAEVGWSDNKLHPVGELYANELGLLDMEGNVEELLMGGKWAFISKNSKKKLSNNNLSGLRLVINLSVDENIKGESELLKILSSYQDTLIKERDEEIKKIEQKKEEERKKAEEEAKRKEEELARKKAVAAEEAKRKAEELARKKQRKRR